MTARSSTPRYAPPNEDGAKPYVVELNEWGCCWEEIVYASSASEAKGGRLYACATPRRATPADMSRLGAPYRYVVLYECPRCKRLFDSPSICLQSGDSTVPKLITVPSPPHVEPEGTCDWGSCDEPAQHWRWSLSHGWLPACDAHKPDQGR